MIPDRTNSSPYSWAAGLLGRGDRTAAKTAAGCGDHRLIPYSSGLWGQSQPPGPIRFPLRVVSTLTLRGPLTEAPHVTSRLVHSLRSLRHNLRLPFRTPPNRLAQALPLPICGAAGGGLGRMAVNQSHTESRRGALIPSGERCLKGSLCSCQREERPGELAARKLSANQRLSRLFCAHGKRSSSPTVRASAASRVF